MGKRGKPYRGRGGGGRGGRGGGGGHRAGVRTDYKEVEKNNEAFENYYNQLGIVEDGEREEFWTALRRELPNSFRFTGSKGHALAVQQRLKDYYIPEITAVEYEGQPVQPPTPLQWYPDQLGWSMTTPKNVVRRFPPFASFQKFLVSETSVGNISRQEVVSMIPPLVMDIKPGMTVLDMCAAPGSKSAQLIEMVHGGEEARVRKVLHDIARQDGREMSPDGMEIDAEKDQIATEGDWSDDGRTTGLLIANDADYRRSQMLIHQVKRLNSPNLIVTNHDATMFPSIKIRSDPPSNGQPPKNKYLKFDRILADVPCSGDGTCRKNPNVWKDWSAGNGLGLYLTQVRILVRALQTLKVGGRVVYSTCSMNPVEDEAVISSAIDRCGGLSKVRVVDLSDALPGLKRAPGLNQWKIIDKQGRIWSSWKEVAAAKEAAGEEGFSKLVEGMFPPVVAENEERIPFERCMRVYPHMQDTGGFFIVALEKLSEIKARPESDTKKIQPKPPVVAAVDEIASRPTNGTNPTEKIEALDDLAPPTTSNEVEGPSAVVRQNKENAPQEKLSPSKHRLDDEVDAELSSKRPRFKEESDEAASRGEENRQVHFPPPPAADTAIVQAPKATLPPSSSDKKKNGNQPYEEPFKYLRADHEQLQIIYDFYGINSRFPRDRFMVRNASGDPVKAIYYTSALAREILEENEGKGMKFVHCGVKMFMKQDVQKEDVCRWRIQAEGLPILEAWVDETRVVRLYKRETLRKLLVDMFPKVAGDGWRNLGEIGERVRDIGMGCCVLRVETSDETDGFKERMVLPLWRSLASLNLMLPKEERRAMLLRLYNDSSPLTDTSKDRFKPKAQNVDSIDSPASSTSTPLVDDSNNDGVAADPSADHPPPQQQPLASEEQTAGDDADVSAAAGLGASSEAKDFAVDVEDHSLADVEDEIAATKES
ncbi:MAG: hypothetical protein M1819_003495 [Sarea resinae]|nr:MAG: hypothetical protein M1819_003495 [Sarea resinae]